MSPSGFGHVPTKKLGIAAAPFDGDDVAFASGGELGMVVASELDAMADPEDVVGTGAPDEHALAARRLADSRTTTRARSNRAPH
jgi:hypothetical protein